LKHLSKYSLFFQTTYMVDAVNSSDIYQDLVEKIIQKQASILGAPVAVRRARNVAGLEVSDGGAVTKMAGNPNLVLTGLVEQFKALSGSVGVDFCKQAAASWLNAHPGVKLPPILL